MSDLPPAVDGERREIRRRAGPLTCYVAGEGPPLLLLHSINAAGSVYEVKPVFDAMGATHRVYAPDLPGYGFSDRSARPYDVPLFVAAIEDVLDEIAADAGEATVHALALSLSSEFLARAAVARPRRFASLAFVTPTGFQRGADRLRGPTGSTREVPGLGGVLAIGLWRRGLFQVLTSRASIRYFLKRTFGSDAVDPGLIDYAWRTTNQPGAEHAPFAFLSGRLFSGDIRDVYEALGLPVWLAHGTRGDFRDFSESGWIRERVNWTVQAFDTGALVHFEQPEAFLAAYRRFLRQPR